MEIGLLFKIAAIGILVTILNQVLKTSHREEQAFLLTIVGVILVLFWILPYIYELFLMMETMFSM